MALITCEDVVLGYDGEIVLTDINFTIESGDYLCVVGENGAGKSTLIKGLLKLINPMRGNIVMSDGLGVSEIGYLPQQTDIQRNFPASILEVVMSGTLNHMGARPFYSRKERMEALDKIDLMGLGGLERRCYQELSGGQQQRVLLARALCATSRMILLDEPAAGLDPVVTADLYDLIKRINTEMKITIVMVSHDMNAALQYASHILHLSHTQLYFGKTSDYVSSDAALILRERGTR
ncbi:MAG: ABC transporter ATP-binding protein [Lachnospiraceae bacterium]|nr:ABC transporter ATP-binding protein [Lachnospiraceae bacterium]